MFIELSRWLRQSLPARDKAEGPASPGRCMLPCLGALQLDFEAGSLAGLKSTYLTTPSGHPVSGICSSHLPALGSQECVAHLALLHEFCPSYFLLLFSSLFVLLLLRPSPNSYSHRSHVASPDGCWVGLISGMIWIPRGYDSLQVSHVPGWSAVKWGGTISLSPSEATQTPVVVVFFCILISSYQLITPVFWI